MSKRLTQLQAFQGMHCFLEVYYERTGSDDVGSLLGDIQLFADGSSTWDPAAWSDWLQALQGRESVTVSEGFAAAFNFLKAYHERTSEASLDLRLLLDSMHANETDVSSGFSPWDVWIACVQRVSGTDVRKYKAN